MITVSNVTLADTLIPEGIDFERLEYIIVKRGLVFVLFVRYNIVFVSPVAYPAQLFSNICITLIVFFNFYRKNAPV